MKKGFVLIAVLGVFACNDNGKINAEADTLQRQLDTTVNELVDSAEAKGSRLLDSTKLKGERLWDSTKMKGDKVLKDVKNKINSLKKKDTIN